MKDTRPNILLIAVHDLGTHLQCYGWDPLIPSANLDRLASEGVRFTNHFATATFCSPSRGSIITGKYPHSNGLMGLVNLDWDLPEGTSTMAGLLGASGYRTILIGLQHEAKDVARLGFHRVEGRDQGRSCHVVTPLVTDFLRQEASIRSPSPFYCRVGFSQVHQPYHPLRPFELDPDRVRPLPWLDDTPGHRRDLCDFYGAIRDMDEAVGTILDALRETGLENETLVVFTTDHGIAFPRAKATCYDPGINVALLVRWPEGFAGNRVVEGLTSHVDILPTLLEAAGTACPGDVQGRSFLPLLRGSPYESREWIFAEKNTHAVDIKRCIRTPRYKLIRNYDEGPLLHLPTDIEITATRRDMGDAHLAPRPPLELYDLQDDPLERNNLADDTAYSSRRDELSGTLASRMEGSCDPILSGPIPRPPDEAGIMAKNKERMKQRLEANRLKWRQEAS